MNCMVVVNSNKLQCPLNLVGSLVCFSSQRFDCAGSYCNFILLVVSH